MSIIYDKPFMTYSQLISLMESRNIIVKDKAYAAHVLRNLSYYTLVNGYKNSFLYSPTTDSFVEGTTFEELYTLHMIDTSLSNIVLKNILLIEIPAMPTLHPRIIYAEIIMDIVLKRTIQ